MLTVESFGYEAMRALLVAVHAEFETVNAHLFRGRLRRPLIEFTEGSSELGAYVPRVRTLRLSFELALGPWGVLVEVLKHELAHQYVFDVLGIHDETAHGPSFRKVCEERGIDLRAAGVPSADPEAIEPETVRNLARIEKLLALAESDNRNEAEVAMAAARRLMLKYNLSEASREASKRYAFRHVGVPTGRRAAWQRLLACILTDHFFVEAIIVPSYRPMERKRATVLELCGTPANLEIAAYTHDFLERTAEALWQSHKRRTNGGGRSDRQSFLYGVMSGFGEKLAADAERTRSEGLVWVGDPQLEGYFKRRHPRVVRSGRGTSVRKDAFSAGHAAGGQIVLHRGVRAGANGGAPRLLGSGEKRGEKR